jgi:hypothetical protein
MAHNIGSREREGQAYMSYHEDGLLDLLIGLAVLLAGIYVLVDLDIPLGAVWVVLWPPIWLSAKKSITARRVPDVEISEEQYDGMWRAAGFVIAALVLLVLAVLVVLWGQSTGNVPEWFLTGLRQYLTPVLGLVGALVLVIAAWLSRLNRLYAYAVLTALAFFGGYRLGVSTALAVTLVGGFIMLWGAVMLIRFVTTHPVQPA